jgi:catechol 2,3-dioxygenase-like lactoylglutathione lyase family enzyme
MAVKRLDNVAVVVDDLDAAIAFFTELGMELEGRAEIEGDFADESVGLRGIKSEIAMMRVPGGPGRLELTRYDNPAAFPAQPTNAVPNTIGLHRVMFAVEDIDDVVARLRGHGAQLLGTIANYDNIYRLCYLHGPAGIIVALAEELSAASASN